MSEPEKGVGPAPDDSAERVGGDAPHVHETHATDREQLLRRLRPDTPERVDGQLLEKTFDSFGRDDGQAVRLLPPGGDLREKLVRRDARRDGEGGRLEDRRFQAPRDRHAERLVPRVLRDVEVRLVERERLDERRHRAVEIEDLLRDGGVALEVGTHDRERGAEAHRARHRNRRAHAELSSLVARGRDDAAALGIPADGNGPSPERGIVALLDGRVEGVHVEVEDAAGGAHDADRGRARSSPHVTTSAATRAGRVPPIPPVPPTDPARK